MKGQAVPESTYGSVAIREAFHGRHLLADYIFYHICVKMQEKSVQIGERGQAYEFLYHLTFCPFML